MIHVAMHGAHERYGKDAQLKRLIFVTLCSIVPLFFPGLPDSFAETGEKNEEIGRQGLRDLLAAQLSDLEETINSFPGTQCRRVKDVTMYCQHLKFRGVSPKSISSYLTRVRKAFPTVQAGAVSLARERRRSPNGPAENWNAELTFYLAEGEGAASDLPPILDATLALERIERVLEMAAEQGLRVELMSLDLQLKTKLRKAEGKDNRPHVVRLREEGASRIVFTTEDWNSGEEVAKLFRTIEMWEASPSVSKRGDEIQVILQLRPRDSYLRGLELQTPVGRKTSSRTVKTALVTGIVRLSGFEEGPKSVHLLGLDADPAVWAFRDEYASVNEAGNYAFQNVPPGDYLLRVDVGDMKGERHSTTFHRRVRVEASGTAVYVNLEYTEEGSGEIELSYDGFYTVTIWTDEESLGASIQRAKYLEPVNDEYKGSYVFRGLPRGEYGLSIVRQSDGMVVIEHAEVRLSEGEKVALNFKPEGGTAALEGRALGLPDGPSEIVLFVRKGSVGPVDSSPIYEARTRDAVRIVTESGIGRDGSYRCGGIEPVIYTVTVAEFAPNRTDRRPLRQLSKPVAVRPAKTARVDFQFESARED